MYRLSEGTFQKWYDVVLSNPTLLSTATLCDDTSVYWTNNKHASPERTFEVRSLHFIIKLSRLNTSSGSR